MDLFLALLIKHAICDLALQRWHGWEGIGPKYRYFNPKAQKHYLEHGFGTLIVFLVFTDPYIACVAAIIDWFCHWHIDCIKSNANKILGWREGHQGFWVLVTIDQILHYITYYVLTLFYIRHAFLAYPLLGS